MKSLLGFFVFVSTALPMFGLGAGVADTSHPSLHAITFAKHSTAQAETKTEYPDQTPNIPIDDVANQIGLTALEYGHIEKDEDERFVTNIKNANNIKILVSNGYNLINNFKLEFTDFLRKPGSSMQVLFATSDSEFYREETEITLGLKPGEEAYTKNLGLVALDRGRLEGYAGPNVDHLQFRYFNTQFRLPIIIIDNKYCYLTVRLSPNEASQSLRMEFTQGYATSCVAHFDRMWTLSSPRPESSRWLAFFGLASWSRTELMALVACIGTLLAGLGTFLAVPPIQKLLRLEKQLEKVDLTSVQDATQIPSNQSKADVPDRPRSVEQTEHSAAQSPPASRPPTE